MMGTVELPSKDILCIILKTLQILAIEATKEHFLRDDPYIPDYTLFTNIIITHNIQYKHAYS